MNPQVETTEVLVIGAGPAGSVAAAMLRRQGRQVLMIERQQFPRFSIGESLLPQSMEYIEAAGLLQDVVQAGFQYKNGAAFVRGEASTEFDFRDKFSPGWGTTYQVQRADFDNVLALMLLLGMGIDYGIFLIEHRGDASAWLAVCVGAASTWLSFGLLGLSQTPALRAFGLTLLFGIGLVWLISPLFRPPPHDVRPA